MESTNIRKNCSRSVRTAALLLFPLLAAFLLLLAPVVIWPGSDTFFHSTLLADPDNGGGGGDNGGGNGGGGGKPQKGELYGDMVYLLRDINGIPITINGCIRPLGSDGKVLALNADDGSTPGDLLEDEYDKVCADPVLNAMQQTRGVLIIDAEAEADDELEACDPIEPCLDNLVEVDLGRLSMLKSPQDVLDAQLEEAINNFTNASNITVDASGRPVTNGSTFDSPLINLALYREYHRWGAIQDEDGNVVFDPVDYYPVPFAAEPFLMAAAFALGAGDDKEGPGIDAEVVIRSNDILALAEGDSVLDTLPFHYEGKTRYFIDYSDFRYVREETFPGNICYDVYTGTKYIRESKSIIEAVFEYDPYDPEVGDWALYTNVGGFGQAADDARHVLVFVHDHNVVWVDSVLSGPTPITEENCPPLEP